MAVGDRVELGGFESPGYVALNGAVVTVMRKERRKCTRARRVHVRWEVVPDTIDRQTLPGTVNPERILRVL